jgi:hypothetical protein
LHSISLSPFLCCCPLFLFCPLFVIHFRTDSLSRSLSLPLISSARSTTSDFFFKTHATNQSYIHTHTHTHALAQKLKQTYKHAHNRIEQHSHTHTYNITHTLSGTNIQGQTHPWGCC